MEQPTGMADEQLRTLDRLSRIPSLRGFYLAGGTAIAFHLRHRRSLDLDLFSASHDVDLEVVHAELVVAEAGLKVLAQTDAMLRVLLDREPIDIVRYRYPPLEAPARGPSGFAVAGLLDLAAMKLAAIARRGIRRDFWDLHAILGAGLTLPEIAAAYVRRFGASESDLYHVARSLTYFDDAEKDPALPAGLDHPHWERIMRFFVQEAPALLGP